MSKRKTNVETLPKNHLSAETAPPTPAAPRLKGGHSIEETDPLRGLSAELVETASGLAKQLTELLTRNAREGYVIGDLVGELMGAPLKRTLDQVLVLLGSPKSRSNLGKYKQAAETIKGERERADIPWFTAYDVAVMRKHSGEESEFCKQTSAAEQCYTIVNARKGKTPSTRQVRSEFEKTQKKKADIANLGYVTEAMRQHPQLSEQLLHDNIENVLRSLPEQSIDFVWLDPPYIDDRKAGGQSSWLAGSYADANIMDFDPLTEEEYRELHRNVFAESHRVLRPSKAIVEWARGGRLYDRECHDIVDDLGWEDEVMGMWDKKHSQPGNFSRPMAVSTELFLTWQRKGEQVLGCDTGAKSRREILDHDRLQAFANQYPELTKYVETWPRVIELADTRKAARKRRKGEEQVGETHPFQKPHLLNIFFLLKYTRPGDCILDCCGCTGGMCLAAIELGRRWIYVEPNEKMFNYGSAKILRAMEQQRQAQKSAA